MKKVAFLIAALATLAGCDQTPGTQRIMDSPTMDGRARFMGTVDGCRLWSVGDGLFYFANCRGGTSSTGFLRRSGKTSHYYAVATDYDDADSTAR